MDRKVLIGYGTFLCVTGLALALAGLPAFFHLFAVLCVLLGGALVLTGLVKS